MTRTELLQSHRTQNRKKIQQPRRENGRKSFILGIGLPSSVCVVDCAINGFIGDQISLSKGDALVFKNRIN